MHAGIYRIGILIRSQSSQRLGREFGRLPSGYVAGSIFAIQEPVLNDSQVLGIRADQGTDWDVSILSANHHAAVSSEIEALRSAHPGELEVVLNDRVLGGIAITRGLFIFSVNLDHS